ncbi:MAG TPA: MFS transporter [Oscillospiraceae bacterium]|nr:MFS transporter [Oscillospiraceae bacterium]
MSGGKLTTKEINMYGAYALASGIGIAIPMSYGVLFMTDHLMISTSIVATLLLVARILDFGVSLTAGAVVQKSNLKWGKYRSWLLILRWVVFTGICLQFINTTSLPMPVRLAIVVIGYFMLHFSMNYIALSQFGVLASMAGTSMEDRTRLSSRQAQFQTAGAIITSASIIPLLNFFKPIVGAANAYIVVAAPFAFVLVIGAGLITKAAEPYDRPEAAKRGGPVVTVKDMINSVVTNSQLLIYVLVMSLTQVGAMGAMGIQTYYFIYVLGNFNLMAVAMTTMTVFSFFAATVGPSIGRKLGKKMALVTGLMIMAASSVCITIFARNSVVTYIIFACLRQGAMYMYMCFGPNYAIDAAEYGLYATGKDNRTVAMSMNNIPIKVGFALGGAIGTFGLSIIGYTAGMTATPEFITGFMWIFGGIPAGFYLLASLIMLLGYKITDEDAAMYARENAAKLAAQKA